MFFYYSYKLYICITDINPEIAQRYVFLFFSQRKTKIHLEKKENPPVRITLNNVN